MCTFSRTISSTILIWNLTVICDISLNAVSPDVLFGALHRKRQITVLMEANIDDCLNVINSNVCMNSFVYVSVCACGNNLCSDRIENDNYYRIVNNSPASSMPLQYCGRFHDELELIKPFSGLFGGSWHSLNWLIPIYITPIDQLTMHKLCNFEK